MTAFLERLCIFKFVLFLYLLSPLYIYFFFAKQIVKHMLLARSVHNFINLFGISGEKLSQMSSDCTNTEGQKYQSKGNQLFTFRYLVFIFLHLSMFLECLLFFNLTLPHGHKMAATPSSRISVFQAVRKKWQRLSPPKDLCFGLA